MQVQALWSMVHAAAASLQAESYPLSLQEVFTFLFVMLGPLKILGPFAAQTHLVEPGARRVFALRATAIALLAVLLGGFMGKILLYKWQVSPGALTIAAGLVFLLVALRMVLAQYDPEETATIAAPNPSAFRFAFPTIVTPYGMAAVILLLTTSHDQQRTNAVLVLVGAVLALDLLAMLFAGPILKAFRIPLAILGVVLGAMQVALAVQLILGGLKLVGLIA